MAHDLDIDVNGKARMFSAEGKTPWHGLGEVVEGIPTAKEALDLAGLDWMVKKVQVNASYFNGGEFVDIPIPDTFANIRDIDNKVLGVVKQNYQIMQNNEAFDFMDTIVGDGAAAYHTAGALDGGRKVWILVKLPGEVLVRVKGHEDVTEKYGLLYNSHDGSTKAALKVTPVRVVCQNTLNLAMRGGAFEIRHTQNMMEKMKEAAEAMGLVEKTYGSLSEMFNLFAQVEMNTAEIKEFTKTVLKAAKMTKADLVDDGSEDEAQEDEKDPRALSTILELNAGGMGSELASGTLWGAYNAITEYVDHQKKYRGDEDARKNNRLKSVWFDGSGQKVKTAAYKQAVKML